MAFSSISIDFEEEEVYRNTERKYDRIRMKREILTRAALFVQVLQVTGGNADASALRDPS